ncbi:hypothetical protein N658DRAFT_503001 [Parathielavia hyrcaniae]|uniref:Uncharacterized protein n=1 Tax=Parathielavia hyrcaniae TaxID=113614 RepID=A0AAN6QE51_9PEZI|nr:hypothetical protein N658DRAFT_503001 [Parathielavia hyrcaniae]
MTRHAQDELASDETNEFSAPAQRKATLTELENASQTPAGRKGRKGPVNGRSSHSGIRLPCPLYVAEPGRYTKITKGCTGSTYAGMQGVNEHISRYHSWDTRCTKCWETFRQSTRKSIAGDKEAHVCIPRELSKEEEETTIPWITKDLQDTWRDWRKSLTKGAASENKEDTATRHWKHVFKILYPGRSVPDPVSISQASVQPEAPPQPSSSHQPKRSPRKQSPGKQPPGNQPPGKQPARKRQASSSPTSNRTGSKMKAFGTKQQGDNGAEDAGINLADPSHNVFVASEYDYANSTLYSTVTPPVTRRSSIPDLVGFRPRQCIDPSLLNQRDYNIGPPVPASWVSSPPPTYVDDGSSVQPRDVPTMTDPSSVDHSDDVAGHNLGPSQLMLPIPEPTDIERRLFLDMMLGSVSDGLDLLETGGSGHYPGGDEFNRDEFLTEEAQEN